ncbi:MAG: hypothetical protein NTY69_01040 [Methylococcales bacterium]|nr:hypothetical protein [Methylococcales bacterium]
MKLLTKLTLVLGCTGLSIYAQAAPKAITAMASPATTYSFFTVNTSKIPNGSTFASIQASLQAQLDLNSPKLTACWVTGDANRTAINCGNGAMQLETNEAYTYNIGTSIAPYPLPTKELKAAILESQVSNFISSVLGTAGDLTGRVVNIHFKQRVAQFGMIVDSGQANAPSITGLQFVINHQTVPVQSLTGGAPNFVGIEDKAGFTDLTIIASGSSRAWVADQLAFVPLSAF